MPSRRFASGAFESASSTMSTAASAQGFTARRPSSSTESGWKGPGASSLRSCRRGPAWLADRTTGGSAQVVPDALGHVLDRVDAVVEAVESAAAHRIAGRENRQHVVATLPLDPTGAVDLPWALVDRLGARWEGLSDVFQRHRDVRIG